MGKWLASLERKDDTSRRATGLVRQSFGRPYTPPVDVMEAIKHWERVTWVYRATDVIAANAASLPVVVRRGDPVDGEVIPNHPVSRLLNQQPNHYESAWTFRYRMSMQLLLSVRGVFAETLRGANGRGDVARMELLPPQSTAPIPDADEFVSGFKVTIGSDSYTVPTEQVLWLRRPHPTNPYQSYVPLIAAGLAADIDWYARNYNRNFLRTDGRPSTLIAVDGDLHDDDADELEARFNGGPGTAGRTSVIDNASGLNMLDLGVKPRDAAWQDARKDAKEESLIAYGVPEALVGNASGRTFANADAEVEIFWRETMAGNHLRTLASELDRLDGDDDTFVGFDLSGIPALQRPERERREFLLMELAADAISRDEYRDETNRTGPAPAVARSSSPAPAADDDDRESASLRGDDYYAKVLETMVVADDVVDAELADDDEHEPGDAPAELGDGTDEVPDPDDATDPGHEHDDDEPKRAPLTDALVLGAGSAKYLSLPSGVSLTGSDQEELASHRAGVIDHYEAMLKRELRTSFKRQRDVAIAKLGGAKARKGTAFWDPPGERKVEASTVYDEARWEETMWAATYVVLEELYDEAGKDAASLLGGTWNPDDPAVKSSIAQRRKLTKGITRTTMKEVADAIAKAESLGGDIGDVEDSLRKVFERATDVRSPAIASDMATGSYNAAQTQAAHQSAGAATRKVWLSANDPRVRRSHVVANGQTVKLAEPFTVGGSPMLYPGDPNGPVAEVANCRCTQLFV